MHKLLVSLIISLPLWGVSQDKRMLQGKWKLTHEVFGDFGSQHSQDDIKELKSGSLIMDIGEGEVAFINRYYRAQPIGNTVAYNYFTEEQSFMLQKKGWEIKASIVVYDKDYSLKKIKRKPELGKILRIVKLNNSQLILENLFYDYRDPINKMISKTYYFSKIPEDTSLISEVDFEGTWFAQKHFENIEEVDTLFLQRDTCVLEVSSNKLRGGPDQMVSKKKVFQMLSFSSVNRDEDRWNVNTRYVSGILDGVDIRKIKWRIDPQNSIIRLQYIPYKKEELVFTYSFDGDKLLLIRNETD